MKQIKKIAVIGAGAWGTAVAKLLAEKGEEVCLWVREKGVGKKSLAEIILEERENITYLPNIRLPENLNVNCSIEAIARNADVIISAVPSAFLQDVTKGYQGYVKPGTTVVSLTKGINYEDGHFKRMSEVLQEMLGIPYESIVALSGPNFAREIAQGSPSSTVVAGAAPHVDIARHLFSTPYFKVYKRPRREDIAGVELGGALKNVYTIAGGICDWLIDNEQASDNSKAALFTRCKTEMVRFGESLGADRDTLEKLAGVGDLYLCFSNPKSRNYQAGYLSAQDLNLEAIQKRINGVAEGIRTVENVYRYAKQNSIDLNIARQIYLKLYEQKPLGECMADLFRQTEAE